jgi:DNA repair exonuclease SbcCD ATPase subunit
MAGPVTSGQSEIDALSRKVDREELKVGREEAEVAGATGFLETEPDRNVRRRIAKNLEVSKQKLAADRAQLITDSDELDRLQAVNQQTVRARPAGGFVAQIRNLLDKVNEDETNLQKDVDSSVSEETWDSELTKRNEDRASLIQNLKAAIDEYSAVLDDLPPGNPNRGSISHKLENAQAELIEAEFNGSMFDPRAKKLPDAHVDMKTATLSFSTRYANYEYNLNTSHGVAYLNDGSTENVEIPAGAAALGIYDTEAGALIHARDTYGVMMKPKPNEK